MMMDQNVLAFFEERKKDFLKKNLNQSLDVEGKAKLLQIADDKFTLSKWLPDAANRASQLSMVSHPGKYSHPSAKISPIVAKNSCENDGYIRSGNVGYELDVFGNAATLDVFKFLDLQMVNGKTVLNHLEEDTIEIKSIFKYSTENYEDLKSRFMKIRRVDPTTKTDQLVKQVYFPVDTGYHLLSILTPSGLITQLKNRIQYIQFSAETKEAKENRRNNAQHASGYSDLINLTVIAYGGTKPQNISALNSKNGGRAYLLPSMPPKLSQRQIRLPTQDFFKNSIHARQFKKNFQSLHCLIAVPVNNIHIREGIAKSIKFIIDQVLHRVFIIRATGTGWSTSEHYRALPLAQRIWLDDANLQQREDEDDWIDDISRSFARWIVQAYEYSCKEAQIKFGDQELREIRSFVGEAVSDDKEFFK